MKSYDPYSYSERDTLITRFSGAGCGAEGHSHFLRYAKFSFCASCRLSRVRRRQKKPFLTL